METTENTAAPATLTTLIAWLMKNGYTRQGSQPLFSKGLVNVAVQDPDSMDVGVYVFSRPGMTLWEARFTSVPLAVLIATALMGEACTA